MESVFGVSIRFSSPSTHSGGRPLVPEGTFSTSLGSFAVGLLLLPMSLYVQTRTLLLSIPYSGYPAENRSVALFLIGFCLVVMECAWLAMFSLVNKRSQITMETTLKLNWRLLGWSWIALWFPAEIWLLFFVST